MNNMIKYLLGAALLTVALPSCEYIHEDLEPCPRGLYLTFEYDYNLQRADLFADHVGSVTAYLYDENGAFLQSRTESGEALAAQGYEMRFDDLEPGRYLYTVLAWQGPHEEAPASAEGAEFRVDEPAPGDDRESLAITLDREADGRVPHDGLPLDTLWHGLTLDPVEVTLGGITRDTVSLVRDTKQINVALHDLDNPSSVDVDNFDFRIYDRNARILWDNSVDERDSLVYTPYATWTTSSKPLTADGPTDGGERIAHADFMTSRLIYHDAGRDDAILSITNRTTGAEVVRINLVDMLSRLRTSADIYRYTPQEFLDRGYDYQLTFFLKGATWEYVNIEIAVLSWAKRVQYEHIQF